MDLFLQQFLFKVLSKFIPENKFNLLLSLPLSVSVSTHTPGVELSFKTRSPDGLLLCALSPGNQEEFLAVQIKNGRPYFLFDPQVCKVFILLKNVSTEWSGRCQHQPDEF